MRVSHGDEGIMGVVEGVVDDCNSAFPPFNPRSRNHFLLIIILSLPYEYYFISAMISHLLRSFAHRRNQLLKSEESFINTIFNKVITLPTGDLPFTE